MQDIHADDANAKQIAFWSGVGGRHWVERQELWDIVLQPVLDAALARAEVRPGEQVIDVGCGCGASSVAVGRRVGPEGRVLGLDVSPPMLALARRRCPPDLPVAFEEADASVYPLPAEAFDLLFSRFGVMFFADPTRAFANLRKGLKPGGRLAFSCFRDPRLNAWMRVPLEAAYEHVPRLPQLGPEDPGPFSFADAGRVHRILEGAGFASVTLEPVDLAFDLGSGRGLATAVESVMRIGPTSAAVEDQPEDVRATVAASLTRVLAPYVTGDAVALPAAIWIVTARNPAA